MSSRPKAVQVVLTPEFITKFKEGIKQHYPLASQKIKYLTQEQNKLYHQMDFKYVLKELIEQTTIKGQPKGQQPKDKKGNKEQLKQKRLEYRRNNQEKIREYNKRHYLKNKANIL